MNQADQRKIQEKLKLMTNYDADQQFMAACDLTEYIEKNHSKILQKTLIRIIDSLIQHLKSQSADVHGNSIKCLSKIISKIPISQSKRISQLMIRNIKDPLTNPDFRDIYGTCVKTIINDVPLEYGDHIKDLLKITIDTILDLNLARPNPKIELELIDIANSFMKKWPKLISKISFNRRDFLNVLLNNIIKKDEGILQKRSYMCLGVYAVILYEEQFNHLFNNGLIKFLCNEANNKNFQKKKYALQALSSVLKTGNKQIQKFVHGLFDYLIKQIITLKDDTQDIGKIQIIGQMLECCINSVISLVKYFGTQFNHIATQQTQFLNLISELVQYNPHNQIQYLTDMQIQQDDEFFVDQQFDDSSWRIRRCVLLLIGEYSKINNSACYHFSKLSILYKRLNEKNQGVVSCALNMFENLINGFIKQEQQVKNKKQQQFPVIEFKRIKSDFKQDIGRFLENLIQQLILIFKHNSTEDSTKNQGSSFIYKLSNLLLHQIINHPLILNKYINFVLQNLKLTKLNQVKINLLLFFQNILNQKVQYDHFKILNILITFSTNSFYKVSASAYRAINSFLIAFNSNIDTNNPLFLQVVNKLINKFKQTDIDQQIKQLIVRCITALLRYYHKKIKLQDVQNIISILLLKLNGEVEKRYIMSFINLINIDLPLSNTIVQKLNQVVKIIGTSFLNHSQIPLKSKSCQALKNCIQILKLRIKPEIQSLILQKSKVFYGQQIFPQYLDSLVKINGKGFKNQLTILLKLKNLPIKAIKQLYAQKVITINDIIMNIKQLLKNQNLSNYTKLLKQLDIDSSIYQNKLADTLEGRLWISVIAYTKNTKYFNLLLNFIKPNFSQDTKYFASISVGIIASNDLTTYLPLLQNQYLKTNQKFYILNSIKQAIIHTQSLSNQLIHLRQSLINRSSQIQNQSLINLISQCIGHIINLNPLASQQFIFKYQNSKSKNHKIIIATSFRFFLNNQNTNQQVLSLFPILLKLTLDNQLQIRSTAIKSLNSITFHLGLLIQRYINIIYLNQFRRNLRFDESLIQIVEFGISKQKVDRGKPVRIDGFTFIEILISKIPIYGDIQKQLISACFDTLQLDTSNDVLLRRINIISRLFQKNRKILLKFDKQIDDKFNVQKGKLKQFIQKKASDDQNIQKLVTAILRLIYLTMKSKTQSMIFLQLYEDITKIQRFTTIMKTFQGQFQ